MIRLNQTASQLISLITAQNGATCVVSYSDKSATGYDGNTQVTAITSATTTTICSTPAASTIRDVDHISVKNTFAGSHTVTVQVSSSAVLYPLVTVALASGDSLEYTHGSGWQVLDANGNKKVTPFSGMTSAQLAALISDETGSGALVFAESPTLVTPALGTPASGDLRNCSLAVAPAIGSTTPSTGKFTTLETTGTIGVASSPLGYVCIRTPATLVLSGAAIHYGYTSNQTYGSDCTNTAYGYYSKPSTQAASFTISNLIGIRIDGYTQGAGSAVTTYTGISVTDETKATNIYGIRGEISSGSNKWNAYFSGTANNAFAGNTRLGGTSAPTVACDVTGAILATTSILSAGATSGVGYATGAGGTVTQATSRTTGVTLNKVSGAITLVSAAGSTTPQTFTVTNSAVAATDTIVINQKSGTDLNIIHITAVAAGSFNVTFWTTGGTTTEQPVFNFNVIKGVAA